MPRLAALAAAVLAATPAAAADRYALAARLGYGTPAGFAFEDPVSHHGVDLSSLIVAQIPLQAEFLYRLNGRVELGAYASYVFDRVGGQVEATCMASGLSCSAATLRAGIEGFYHFLEPSPKLFPWVGAGFGWEWMHYEQGLMGRSYRISFNGPEFIALQAGFDYTIGSRMTLGPYALGTFAVYTGAQQEATGFGTETVSIGKSVHEWLSLGMRVRYSW